MKAGVIGASPSYRERRLAARKACLLVVFGTLLFLFSLLAPVFPSLAISSVIAWCSSADSVVGSTWPAILSAHAPPKSIELCPQSDSISPVKHNALSNSLEGLFAEEAFRLEAYESLGAAVRVPYVPRLVVRLSRQSCSLSRQLTHRTVTFDDFGLPGEDPRWETRLLLHKVLEKRFPHVYVATFPRAVAGLPHRLAGTQL
jgi:hypothetical protein